MTDRDYRRMVESLTGPDMDAAVESAMANAVDLGLSEEDDGLAFWREVYGQVAS